MEYWANFTADDYKLIQTSDHEGWWTLWTYFDSAVLCDLIDQRIIDAVPDFAQMKKICISQGSAVTFFTFAGQICNRCCQISPGFYILKLLKSLHFWLSYSKNKRHRFFETRWTYVRTAIELKCMICKFTLHLFVRRPTDQRKQRAHFASVSLCTYIQVSSVFSSIMNMKRCTSAFNAHARSKMRWWHPLMRLWWATEYSYG